MRLMVSKTKNAASLYVIKSVYDSKSKSNTSVIVEKLGTELELREKLNGADPYEWAKEYIKSLNEQEKEQTRTIMVPYRQTKMLDREKQNLFNCGYLFLQKIYHELSLDKICKDIESRYKFSFSLDAVLSRLLYGRIIFPSSKLNTYEVSSSFLEQPVFELQHVYRSLDVLEKEDSFIQSELYKNSKNLSGRNDKILFYDCTNYFFETEQENGLRQYGPCKEHRPNPIVEMGLFMDGDGIPLAFSIHAGNKNEQQTLIPLEQQIMKDFDHREFVVCTDAGLSSTENRKFNNKGKRSFVTTQSIKKLKEHLKEWSLSATGWHMEGDSRTFDISNLESSEEMIDKYKNTTFFKERWINENGLEQKLIVTFSLKYKNYQLSIRNRQMDRARKLLEKSPSAMNHNRPNDCKRFINKTAATSDGEIASKEVFSLNEELYTEESKYDGYYAVCTNLEDSAPQITKINHRRWEIEECFRIMKSDFEARPVYLQKDARIKAHFMTCFLSLILFRYLEKKLNYKYTSNKIIETIGNMRMHAVSNKGFAPVYTRTELTDDLHEAFGFRTDYEILTLSQMKKIFKDTKK